MASLDTIVLRLHGIHEVKTDQIDLMKSQYGGLTPFLVPEHQSLYNAMLQYEGKYFTMDRIFKEDIKEFSALSEEDYLALKSSKVHKTTFDYLEFRDGSEHKKIELSTRGRLNVKEHFLQSQEVGKTKIEKSARGRVRTPSSINYVQFKLNPNGQYIEFEFSIPKYLYGHNLAEFIPQGGSNMCYDNGDLDWSKFSVQKKFLYPRLIKFIDKFFTDLCVRFKLDTMPNLNYVQIMRADFCYNQRHESKEEALKVLNEKKKLNSKKHRKNQKNVNANGYETSLIYRTNSGSYFKIYHKGSEYRQSDGDLSKHLKINRAYLDKKFKNMTALDSAKLSFKQLYYDNRKLLHQVFHDHTKGALNITKEQKDIIAPLYKNTKHILPYDTKFLAEEMDKILRYEVSLSGAFFKYNYKNKIFRKDDFAHQHAMKIYKRVKSAYDSRNPQNEQKVLKYEHKIHKKMHSYLNRSIALTLSDSSKIKCFEKMSHNKRFQLFDYDEEKKTYSVGRVSYVKTQLAKKDVGIFSEEVLHSCVDHFHQLMKYFKVDSIQPVDDFSSKIKDYNVQADINLKHYNRVNHNLILDYNGNRKIKGNKVITSASQLLTEKERQKLQLQKINPAPLIGILNFMQEGGSMQEYFKLHNITSSSKHRYKSQLEQFKIFDNSLIHEKPIIEKYDYEDYYWLTSSHLYRQKFYFKQNHYNLE